MALFLLAVLGGLVLLWRAADEFVVGAARIADALRISPVVIGAVVIGFGTSAPEMVVSALAAGQGDLDIAVGNIVGSNIANLTLVLGVASLIVPMAISSTTLRREAPISAAAVVLFAVLVQDGLTRVEAGVATVALVAALVWVLAGARGGDSELAGEVDEYLEAGASHSLRHEGVRTFLGLAAVVLGAQLMVYGAQGVAEELGIDEGFVGLTLVALGTSLPELVTSVQAARRNEEELVVGNLLGSNLFNSLAVGAAAGFVGPGALADPTLAGLATVIMVVVAVGAWGLMATQQTVVRWEAVVLLGSYAVAVPLLAT